MPLLPLSLRDGETVEVWLKSSDPTRAGRALLSGPASLAELAVVPSDDFLMARFSATGTGTVIVEPEPETVLSLAYAFDPARVLTEGIRILFATEANRAVGGPLYHLAPPFGWMNDPNGLVCVGEDIHLFYQHYPHERRWNAMHWGHAVSHDGGANFVHLPIFLHPRAELLTDGTESGGAFSGSAIAGEDGSLRIFYTDRRDSRPEWEWQMTAVSTDAILVGAAAVLIDRRPDVAGFQKDFRDPYVFLGPDGLWKMLLGGRDAAGAVILLYESDAPDAARDWRFVDVLFRSDALGVQCAECPCLVPVGEGLWALIYCLMTSHDPETGRHNLSHAIVGDFDGRRFAPRHRQEIDFGTDAYAFQAIATENGTIAVAWAANWADVVKGRDFPSAMTLMRKIEWRGDHLATPPLDALTCLRGTVLTRDLTKAGGAAIPDGAAELTLRLARPNAPFRLSLIHPTIRLDLVHDGRRLELRQDGQGVAGPRIVAPTPGLTEFRLFVDRGVVEVYAEGGRWCCTKRLDDPAPVTALRLEARPGDIAETVVWEIAAAGRRRPEIPEIG